MSSERWEKMKAGYVAKADVRRARVRTLREAGLTFQEIANRMKVSRQRVYQLYDQSAKLNGGGKEGA